MEEQEVLSRLANNWIYDEAMELLQESIRIEKEGESERERRRERERERE